MPVTGGITSYEMGTTAPFVFTTSLSNSSVLLYNKKPRSFIIIVLVSNMVLTICKRNPPNVATRLAFLPPHRYFICFLPPRGPF